MQKNNLIDIGIVVLALITLMIISPVIQAKMYKWVDAGGNTHYTQSPPPEGIDGETIKPPSKVDTDAAHDALTKQKKKADELLKKRTESKEQAAKEKEQQAELGRHCDNARKRVASYQRPKVNLVDENGNRTQITEEQRQKTLAEAQQYVKENCQ